MMHLNFIWVSSKLNTLPMRLQNSCPLKYCVSETRFFFFFLNSWWSQYKRSALTSRASTASGRAIRGWSFMSWRSPTIQENTSWVRLTEKCESGRRGKLNSRKKSSSVKSLVFFKHKSKLNLVLLVRRFPVLIPDSSSLDVRVSLCNAKKQRTLNSLRMAVVLCACSWRPPPPHRCF